MAKKRYHNKENKKKQKEVSAPSQVSVRTAKGNIVTMRQVIPEEIKALRNPAYQYLC